MGVLVRKEGRAHRWHACSGRVSGCLLRLFLLCGPGLHLEEAKLGGISGSSWPYWRSSCGGGGGDRERREGEKEGGRKAGEREEDSIGRGTGDVVTVLAVLACLRRRCCAVCSA